MSLVLDTGTMKYRENPNQPWRPLVIKAGMNWESMADTYDPDNGTYEVGQYVLEDGVMYRCIYPIDTPETWTPDHWTEINIGDELFSLQDSIASEATTRASEDTLIRNTLNTKADVIYDTASGSIASFPDGADGLPLKDLTVGIEPVQDSHGYDYPWPAGGGKNLIPDGTDTNNGYVDNKYLSQAGSYSASNNCYVSEYFIVSPSTVYTFSQNSNLTTQSVCFYDSNKDYVSGVKLDGLTSQQITTPSNAAYARSTQLKDARMLQFELGSVATPIMPYSNICPISGKTGCNVTKMGKNLFDKSVIRYDNSYYKPNGSRDDNTSWFISNFIFVLPNTTYTLNLGYSSTSAAVRFLNRNKEGSSILAATAYSGNVTTFTTPSDCYYVSLSVYKSTKDVTQLELGSTATDYESYSSETLPISWQTEAGTVYGGTLDVTSGVLTVMDVQVDLGDLTWKKTTGYTYPIFYVTIDNMLIGNQYNYTLLCSEYIPYGVIGITNFGNNLHEKEIAIRNSYGQILVQDSSYNNATVEEMKAGVSGIKLVYKLATPQTYQLDPVTVNTLLCQNNIWADCGPSTVEYPCDTKLYIQKINAPTDDDMIADANIASGKYFIVNNNLYLSTAAILAGDPIKPGTNCTLTNLAAALNAINS